MAKHGLASLPAAPGNSDAVLDERELRPDYAARLRNAFQDASGLASVSREDAMGAAAEIEQLWAAFRMMVGFKMSGADERDRPTIWGIMTIGIGPVRYVAGWGITDGMDAVFGWDGD